MLLIVWLASTQALVRPEGAVAAWHSMRRREITKALGVETVRKLSEPMPELTLTALASANVAQVALATHQGELWWLSAMTVGAWLSLAQFALLHDVLHSRGKWTDRALFFGSAPSVFGYWLYLALGHMGHHAATGDHSAKALFASDSVAFEDGDLFFACHRQDSPNGKVDDPRIISISRFAYRNLWGHGPLANKLVYASSTLFERFALACNDKLVAVTGSNFFFPNKPRDFHDKCANYARFTALVQACLFVAGGWHALAYLLVAETAWQLPFFPASALFYSNHGVRDDGRSVGGATQWPTNSVYGSFFFDLLCWNANYHLEHHDFPAVPLWNLPELRKRAGDAWYPDSPAWPAVIEDAFASFPIIYPTWSRAQLLGGDLATNTTA